MTTAAFLEDIMRPSFRTIAVSTLTLIVAPTLATTAEVRVLSVGSTQMAAKAIATEFEKQTGHKVIFTIRPPFNIDKELAEKTFYHPHGPGNGKSRRSWRARADEPRSACARGCWRGGEGRRPRPRRFDAREAEGGPARCAFAHIHRSRGPQYLRRDRGRRACQARHP